MKDNKIFKYNKYLTEGILLLLLTIFVYSLSFAYDYGYGSVFNIPTNFISFSTSNLYTTIFILVVAIGGILLYYFNNFKIKRKDAKQNDREYHNFYTNLGFLIITTIIYAIYSAGIWWLWIIPASLIAWILLRHFILPFFFGAGKSFTEKHRDDLKVMGEKVDTFTDLVFCFPILNVTIYIFIAFALFGFVVNFGAYKANTQKSYYVPVEEKGFVVARFYDDKAILVDVKDNKIGNKIKVVSSSDGKYSFEYKETGVLKK